MRAVLRLVVDGCLAALMAFIAVVLQCTLLSICKANLQKSPLVQQCGPIYSRSDRRNRVRY